MRTVSATLSPLEAELFCALAKPQYLAAKAHHGRFKTQTRAGTRLIKERGKDLTFTLVG